MHLCAELLLDLLLDVDHAAVLEVGGAVVAAHVGLLTVLGGERCGIETGRALVGAVEQSQADGVIVGRGDHESRGEDRHLQLVGAVVLGEHAVALNLGGLHNGTADGLACGGIEHLSLDRARLILLLLGCEGTNVSFLNLVLVIAFDLSRGARREGQKHGQSK